MKKLNRYFSFELLFAVLLIVAFFLPWVDYGPLKTIGWKVPGLNETMTKVTNFVKFFSKNKDSVYTGYALYIVPLLSSLTILLWVGLKPRIARFMLFITSFLGVALSIYMFSSLPGVGNGVYLLLGTSIVAILYVIFVPKIKKEIKEEVIEPANAIPVTDSEDVK